MKKWTVHYTTKDGEHGKVWNEAYNEEQAKAIAKQEHWEIDNIYLVTEIR